MAEDIVSIGIALDTSKVLQGTRQVDAALKSVATASTSTAQATQKLDQASKTAGQSMTTESKAAQTATQSLRQMGQAAQAAGQQIGGIGSAMRSFASQTGSFALAQAGVLGFQAALSTAKDAVADLVKTGIQIQNLRTSFAAASGSAKAGAEDFRFVVKTANDLGLGLQSVAEQYRSLAAATRGTTLQGAETREIFVTLSKAAQAYGLSNEQLGRAMTALQQIISKGKVSMEELRGQLGEALPGALQVAARAYGVTTQALETMIEKGVAGEEFARKWITQLGTEVPAAAGRAGKGISQLGNEILLLKDAIAKSGLVAWIDSVSAKLAGLMRQTRETEEAAQRAAARRAERGVGAETFEGLPVTARDQLAAQQRREADAKAAYEARRAVQSEGTFLGIKTQTQVSKELYEAEQQRTKALEARIVLQDAEGKEQAKRQATLTAGFKEQEAQVKAIDAENKKLKETQDAGAKSLDDFNKKAALAPEIFGKANGTLKEQLTLLEQRNAVTKKSLTEMTEQLASRPAGAGPVPPELLAKQTGLQAQYRGELADIERVKKAIEDVADAERKREQDAKDAIAEFKKNDEERKQLDKQQGEEVTRTHFQHAEQLKKLAASYGEVKSARDEDTASWLAQSLAISGHNEEAQRHLKLIQDTIAAEKKLPELRADAAASAEALTKSQREMARLDKEFDRPRRRGQTTEERLTDAYAAKAQQPYVTMGQLAESAAKMQEALDAEMWEQWEEVGIAAMDHVSDAIEDFVFKGKLSFKDMMGAIAQDLFRFSTQTLMQQATKKGGWLEMGLEWGQKALSIYLGASGGMPTSGTLPTTEAAYQAGSAAGLYSGRQHGGPVMGGTPYVVGEAGPELFVPRMSGTVLPHGQGVASPTIVNVHVSGVTDAQSFVQSRGAVSRAMVGALAQARQQM